MMFHLYIPEGICFAAFVALSFACVQANMKKKQQKKTIENMQSITTCKKRQQKTSEADSFRNIKVKHRTHLKIAM
jgi:hypothetical protein